MLVALSARAQYSDNNYQTNIIDGVTNIYQFGYTVGRPTNFGDVLIITNGGALLTSGWCSIGSYEPSSSNNTVTVTGPGSVWNNSGTLDTDLVIGDLGPGNSLTIADGGAVFNGPGRIGYFLQDSKNNTVTVTGTGSVWSNRAGLYVGWVGVTNSLTIGPGGSVFATNVYVGSGHTGNKIDVAGGTLYIANSLGNHADLSVGYFGSGNALTISNGGGVFNAFSYVGNLTSSDVNTVTLTDTGSVWASRNDLYVGYSGNSNALTIGAGSSVLASNVYVGFASSSNKLDIIGGSLYATNALGNGLLEIRGGNLTFNDGTVTADKLLLTNGSSSIIAFGGGTMHSKNTAVTNGQQFVIGDGLGAATYHLMGGVHSFGNSLSVRANSYLTGCGTINGLVVVDVGGTVLADCGGTLTFFKGTVTNNGIMRAINGSTLEFYAKLVNNGTVDVINGSTNFHLPFINNGTILDASSVVISQTSVSGNDVIVKIQSVAGHTYQMQITPSLSPPTWADSGPAQAGTDGVLTFTDVGGATNQPSRLYRIEVTAP